MASPTIESLCCIQLNSGFAIELLEDFHAFSYNLVSIFASALGISGALFQIFRKENGGFQNFTNFNGRLRTRGRNIIQWLAISDLMAALGIFIRSVAWVSGKSFGSSEEDGLIGQVFCVITSGWIHYFYTVTYAWTFLYALDVKLVLQGKKLSFAFYHISAWTLPAVISLVGLLFLYLPDFNCYSMFANPYLRFLPNYLSTFLPILFVMVSNPFLYLVSFSSVEKLLPLATGRYTEAERKTVQSLKFKFLLINFGFFVCWFPNVLNGILLWSAWDALPKYVVQVIWYLMAILNPLQAVLNCFAYRQWGSADAPRQTIWRHSAATANYSAYDNYSSDDEELLNTYEPKASESKSNLSGLRPSAILRSSAGLKLSEKTPLINPLTGSSPQKGANPDS